jgi:hypothetical protein
MTKRWGVFLSAAALAVAGVIGSGGLTAEASHNADNAKKHKAFFHLNEGDPKKALAVLVNMENYVSVVGWQNIEALELVVHGPGLRPFMVKDIDPDVKGKIERLIDLRISNGYIHQSLPWKLRGLNA